MNKTQDHEIARSLGEPIRLRIVADGCRLEAAWQQLLAGQPVTLNADWSPPPRYLRRLAVKQRQGRIHYLKVEDVDWIEAERQYVRLHCREGTFLTRGEGMSLKDLAVRLNPERFMRVHRSHIVNLDRIEALRIDDSGKRYADLVGGHDVPVSQTCWDSLQLALTD